VRKPPTARTPVQPNPLAQSKPLPKLNHARKHVNAVAGPSAIPATSMLIPTPIPKQKPIPKQNQKPNSPRKCNPPPRKRLPAAAASSEGEVFDFDAVDNNIYSDDDKSAIPPRRGNALALSPKAKSKSRSKPKPNQAFINITRTQTTTAAKPTRAILAPSPSVSSPSPSPTPWRAHPRKRAWKDGEVDFFEESVREPDRDGLARALSVLSVSSNADPPSVGRAFCGAGVVEVSD